MQLIGLIFFAAHYLACSWHKLGIYELDNPDPNNSNVWLTSSLEFDWHV